MRSILCCCALVSLVAAGCGSTKTVTRTVTVSATAKSGAGAPRQVVEYGYLKSLKPKGGTYELRFDPAWLLTGKTANVAQSEEAKDAKRTVPNAIMIANDKLIIRICSMFLATVLRKLSTDACRIVTLATRGVSFSFR